MIYPGPLSGVKLGLFYHFFRADLNLYNREARCYHKFSIMINYILLYKIRKKVKNMLKEKIADDELATTEKSCIGCLADELSWEIYYLIKDEKKKGKD